MAQHTDAPFARARARLPTKHHLDIYIAVLCFRSGSQIESIAFRQTQVARICITTTLH